MSDSRFGEWTAKMADYTFARVFEQISYSNDGLLTVLEHVSYDPALDSSASEPCLDLMRRGLSYQDAYGDNIQAFAPARIPAATPLVKADNAGRYTQIWTTPTDFRIEQIVDDLRICPGHELIPGSYDPAAALLIKRTASYRAAGYPLNPPVTRNVTTLPLGDVNLDGRKGRVIASYEPGETSRGIYNYEYFWGYPTRNFTFVSDLVYFSWSDVSYFDAHHSGSLTYIGDFDEVTRPFWGRNCEGQGYDIRHAPYPAPGGEFFLEVLTEANGVQGGLSGANYTRTTTFRDELTTIMPVLMGVWLLGAMLTGNSPTVPSPRPSRRN